MNMWDQAEHALGGKIEILCNNAGVPAMVDIIVIDRPQAYTDLNCRLAWTQLLQ